MGGAPVIEEVRPGVAFALDAARAFRRAEASWGSTIRCNSTYRDYTQQLRMYDAWMAWVQGWGPKPDHSRAIHPDYSKHCQGLALDTDLWAVPGFLAHMAEHGWIQILPNDPTERHHLEYQWWKDQHRNDPVPEPEVPIEESEEDDMPKNTGITYVAPEKAPAAQQRHVILIHNTGSGFEFEIDNGIGGGAFDGGFTNKLAKAYDTPDWIAVTEGAALNIKKGLAAVRAAQ